MNVAVPSFQQSKMFGHPASSHTVVRARSRVSDFNRRNSGLVSSFTRIHDGLRSPKSSPSVTPACSRRRCNRTGTGRDSGSGRSWSAGLDFGWPIRDDATFIGVPGPSPRLNGAKSCEVCFHATSIRSDSRRMGRSFRTMTSRDRHSKQIRASTVPVTAELLPLRLFGSCRHRPLSIRLEIRPNETPKDQSRPKRR